MKILLINQTFFPDIVATAQYLTDLAVDLTKAGHDVTVLTSRRSYLESHRLYPAREIYEGIEIIRVWSFSFGRKGKVSRVLDALFLNLSFAWRFVWLARFDKVIAMTTPPLVGWIASLLAKWRGSELVYWLMDINPDQVIQAGWIRHRGFPARLLETMLKFSLRRSDKIVVLDHFMKENIVSKGIVPAKVEIMSPWVLEDLREGVPHRQNNFRAQHHLNGKFVVMYSGNHSVCHPLDTILQAALILKSDPSIQFMFVGGGVRMPEVFDFKAKHNLSNVTCLPYQERGKLKDSLSAADLHTVVMGDRYIGIVHPSKIYGILGVGRPFILIGPAESPIGELIKETGIGCQVEHGDVEGFIRAVHEVKQTSPNQKQMAAQKSIELTNSRFNRKTLTQGLTELICHDNLSG